MLGGDIKGATMSTPDVRSVQDDRLLLGVAEVARRLDMGERTIWRLAGSGDLPAPLKIGGRRLWHLPTLEQFIAKQAAQEGGRR